MESNFEVAREFLECAQNLLCGTDEISKQVNHALDLLSEALIEADLMRPRGNVVFLSERRQ